MRLTAGSVFVFVLFIGLFTMATNDINDPDFWWHLQTGKYIVENHVVPSTDPSFAFTTAGKRWVTHEWLSEALLWVLYRSGGAPLLGMLFAGLIVAAYALVYARSPGKPYVAGFALLLGALNALPIWGIRIQMVTLFLCSLTVFLLERYFDRPSRNILFSLPVIMALWVNLHGGFLLGIALIVGYLSGKSVELITKQHADDLPTPVFALGDLLRLAGTLILCLAVVGLNPNGYRIFMVPLGTLASGAMQKYIVEWFSPNFHEAIWLPFAILMLGILALGLYVRKRQPLTAIGLVTVSGYAALRSARNVPLFGVVAAPVMASQISNIIQWRPSTQKPARRVGILLTLFIFALTILAAAAVWTRLDDQAKTDRELFPVGAADWIVEHRPPGNLFNVYHWGGYLIWRLNPDYPVFIDGRADLHGDQMMTEYLNIHNTGRGWEEALNSYGIGLVLVEPDSPIALQLEKSAEWEKVYSDKLSSLFVKRK